MMKMNKIIRQRNRSFKEKGGDNSLDKKYGIKNSKVIFYDLKSEIPVLIVEDDGLVVGKEGIEFSDKETAKIVVKELGLESQRN